MAINFSVDEIEKIDKQKKPSGLPSYYSSDSKSRREIGRDFEGFLILQSTDQKQVLLKWLQQVNDIEQDNTDRDKLTDQYLDLRTTDATARIAELDLQLKGFDKFRSSLFGDGADPSRFAEIVELNTLIQAMQRPLEEITIQREIAFHERNLAKLINNRRTKAKSNKDTEKELKSWQSVVTAYPGQKKATGKPSGLSLGGLL